MSREMWTMPGVTHTEVPRSEVSCSEVRQPPAEVALEVCEVTDWVHVLAVVFLILAMASVTFTAGVILGMHVVHGQLDPIITRWQQINDTWQQLCGV